MWSTIRWGERHPRGLQLPPRLLPKALDAAYKRCGTITADYAKTFYLVGAEPSMQFRGRENYVTYVPLQAGLAATWHILCLCAFCSGACHVL